MICDDCPGGTDWEDRALLAEVERDAALAVASDAGDLLVAIPVGHLKPERDALLARIDQMTAAPRLDRPGRGATNQEPRHD